MPRPIFGFVELSPNQTHEPFLTLQQSACEAFSPHEAGSVAPFVGLVAEHAAGPGAGPGGGGEEGPGGWGVGVPGLGGGGVGVPGLGGGVGCPWEVVLVVGVGGDAGCLLLPPQYFQDKNTATKAEITRAEEASAAVTTDMPQQHAAAPPEV